MKSITKLVLLCAVAMSACSDGYIDEIKNVPAEADAAAPTIAITYPLEGTLIRVTDDVTPINIQFTAADDVELKDVTVQLNSNTIATYDEFLDFRKAVKEFTYNNLTNGQHTLTVIATDLAGKTTTKSVQFEKVEPYRPIYDGEIFYMPFDGDNMELVTITNATRVGNPSFSTAGKKGSAYAGATGAYVTLPSATIKNPEISAVFWYKVNAVPDRAGIISITPPGPTNNDRTKGLRLFREAGAAGKQRIKLNMGTGSSDVWVDGGTAADIAADGTWVHVAFTISNNRGAVYINGTMVKDATFSGINWTGADLLSIGSGAPNFTEWNHLSDLSLIDELRIFNKALTQAEIQTIITNES